MQMQKIKIKMNSNKGFQYVFEVTETGPPNSYRGENIDFCPKRNEKPGKQQSK